MGWSQVGERGDEESEAELNRVREKKNTHLKKHWGSWLGNFSPFGWEYRFSHPAFGLLLPPSGQHTETVGEKRRER